MSQVRKVRKILNFNIILTEEVKGGYSVSVPDLPGCYTQGETIAEAVAMAKEAIELYIEDEPKSNLAEFYTAKSRAFVVPIEVNA